MGHPIEWTLHRLGDITFESRARAAQNGGVDLPVFGVNNQTGLDTNSKYHAENLDRYKIVKPGMFAYNPMRLNIGSIGYCSDSLGEGLVSPDYVVFGCREKSLLSKYLFYCTQGHRWQDWMRRAGAGSVRTRIYYQDISRYQIAIPPLPEQCKIAEILSTWDEAIAKTEQLIATLRERKKGLMQRLLTGQVRFPGFEGEWKEKRLGEIVEIIYGKSPSGIQVIDGSCPIFGTGGIVGYTNTPICSEPSVIIGRKGSIDKPQLALKPFWAIDTTFYCRSKENLSMTWLFYLLSLDGLSKHNEGSTIPSLSRTTIDRLKLNVPPFEEQQKIASTLQKVDEEIDLQLRSISLYQQQKKGLMQRLLTGQVRVKV